MVEGKASTNFIRGILYLLPALILLGIFTFYPLINTFIISFKEDYDYMTGSYKSFGFENYQLIFLMVLLMMVVFMLAKKELLPQNFQIKKLQWALDQKGLILILKEICQYTFNTLNILVVINLLQA